MSCKCVIVLDEKLPTGLVANSAAILGLTLGRKVPELVGRDTVDGAGRVHLGIINLTLPILKSDTDNLRALRDRLYGPEYAELTVVDFSATAQHCKDYEDYVVRAAAVPPEDHCYYGLAVHGPQKMINKLTGSLPLLR